MKQQINNLLQIVSQGCNDKIVIRQKQPPSPPSEQFIGSLSLHLIKFYNQFYRFHKSLLNYKEKNYKKSIFMLTSQYSLKLNIVAKDQSSMNQMFLLY